MVKSKARKSFFKVGARKSGKASSKTPKKPADKAQQKSHPLPASASSTSAGAAETAARSNTNGQSRQTTTPQAQAAQISAAEQAIGTIKSHSGIDLTEKIKELVRLAQEQGYLTYNDINDALPDSMVNPEDLDDLYIKLRSLEVEIVDQAEVDRVKQPELFEEEEEKARLDI